MTSKEALSSLKEEYYIENDEHIITFNANDDRLKIIEKDLEVLEIIKEHKLLNYVIKNKKCAKMYHLNCEKLELLKEWSEKNERYIYIKTIT